MHKKSVLYYDGECKLCNTWLVLIRRFDKHKRIDYISLQSTKGKAVLERLQAETEQIDTVVFEKTGVLSIRSEAVLNCLAELGGGWTATRAFRIFPLQFRDAVYNFIARNRYRWFGKMNNC
ncbi:MAG: DCC1-like thiol-disulfide oxidoreductase family protein [Paludibacter sp.]|jgi:predicted DCC family thiol-disulfide oxidoreductase YuxK|nr:DCC1-like thiol-disulfide oxidoreductase family protein [Paludibacter sp.]